MTRGKIVLGLLVLAALGAGRIAVAVYLGSFKPGEPVTVEIPSGLSAGETADLLVDNGVIDSAFLFHLAAKYTGYDRKLKPGKYPLRKGMAIMTALQTIKGGVSNETKIVIPEGFSARQIAERLHANGICKADDFMKVVESLSLEGYLFPTTYHFEPGWDAEKVAKRMRQEFDREIGAEFERTNPKPELTLHQVLTLASIVQREAVLPAEKPMIAAVYLNRMRLRMRLEADPTVQYAVGAWKKGLTRSDLANPSPYNTYVHYGLPPGPICSPGLDSVQGVLHPAATDAIYFVADARGGHVFSATLEEHNKARHDYKKELRRQERESQAR